MCQSTSTPASASAIAGSRIVPSGSEPASAWAAQSPATAPGTAGASAPSSFARPAACGQS